MKNLKKLLVVLLSVVCAFTSVLASGCKKPVPNDAQSLQIFITNAGYGIKWLDDELALFKEQDWVKEKYPNLNILEVEYNSAATQCGDYITAGPNANTFDLLFTCNEIGGYYNAKYNGSYVFEDLSDVYDSTVPGESVKVKDKLIDTIYAEQAAYRLDDGAQVYYSIPWVVGAMGMFVNETALKASLGQDAIVPRTSNEFVATCEAITAKRGGVNGTNGPAAIAVPRQSVYWESMFTTWWAQYEGLENYVGYWNGTIIDDEGIPTKSPQIFAQTGRLRSLEAIEKLIGRAKGFYHPSLNESYDKLQYQFLNGNAVFMANGDWIENETAGITDDVILLCKSPVISSITETCDTVTDEEKLLFVIDCIDQGKDYNTAKEQFNTNFGGTEQNPVLLSSADYNHISEARNIMNRVGGHTAHIPSYATAKEVAKDFLRFLATDLGIETFIKAGNGFTSAYEFDSTHLINDFSPLQQSHNRLFQTSIQIPHYSNFRLHYYGGLNYLNQTKGLEIHLLAEVAGDRKTAQEIFDADVTYFTGNPDNFWNKLSDAGIR